MRETTAPVTIGEAARILDRCAETIRDYVDAGRLPCVRIGPLGIRVFDRADVEKLATELAEKRVK